MNDVILGSIIVFAWWLGRQRTIEKQIKWAKTALGRHIFSKSPHYDGLELEKMNMRNRDAAKVQKAPHQEQLRYQLEDAKAEYTKEIHRRMQLITNLTEPVYTIKVLTLPHGSLISDQVGNELGSDCRGKIRLVKSYISRDKQEVFVDLNIQLDNNNYCIEKSVLDLPVFNGKKEQYKYNGYSSYYITTENFYNTLKEAYEKEAIGARRGEAARTGAVELMTGLGR